MVGFSVSFCKNSMEKTPPKCKTAHKRINIEKSNVKIPDILAPPFFIFPPSKFAL